MNDLCTAGSYVPDQPDISFQDQQSRFLDYDDEIWIQPPNQEIFSYLVINLVKLVIKSEGLVGQK